MNDCDFVVSDRIRRARVNAGMTQIDLAQALETSSSVISRYESGKMNPTTAAIRRIAKATGVKASWLVSEEDEDTVTVPKEWWKKMVDLYRGMAVLNPAAEPLPPSLIQFQNWHDLTNHVHPLVVTSPPPEDMPGTQLATVSSPIDPHSSWVECFSLPCVASAFAV